MKSVLLLTFGLAFAASNFKQVDRVTGCRNVKMELVFLADGSTSVSQKSFLVMRDWIKSFISNFDISETTTRASVVQFSDRISDARGYGFPLSGRANEINRNLDNLQYMTGNTRAGEALRYVRDKTLQRARPGASQVLIVLTDGVSQDEVKEAASALIGDKAIIFAVGIGPSVDATELVKIAALPENVEKTANYEALEQITDKLYAQLCSFVQSETCSAGKQDIAFVVDSSSSITVADYKKLKTWIKTIIEGLDIGASGSRVAILQFSGTRARPYGNWINSVANFKDSTDKETLLRRVDGMKKLNGDTCIGEAINYFYENMFTTAAGLREGVSKRVIVMTDGKKNCPMGIEAPSQKIRDEGASVYAIGVGERCRPGQNHGCYDLEELKTIASNPDEKFIFESNNFDQLILKRIGILSDVCEEDQCPNAFVDLVFVLDGSGSIGAKRFGYMKTWMKQVADNFQIGENYARVGLVHYNKTNVVEIPLSDPSQSNDRINSMIDQVQYKRGGKTYTGQALQVAQGQFPKDNGGRKQVLILVTDGSSDDDYKVPADRIRNAGIDIFAVGVGNSKLSELQEITGVKERAWRTRRFKEIAQFNQKLIAEICDATEAACPDQEVDLVFMLDSSGSIGNKNFEIAREWLISITKSFQIGPLQTQVSVIQYTDHPTPEFDLNDFATVEEVEDGLRRMELANGATRTDKALAFANEQIFSEEFGARASAPKVIVLLTDGQDNNPEEVIAAAKNLQQKAASIFVIGIGNPDRMNVNMMNSVATEPVVEHIKQASTVEGINKFKSSLTKQICEDAKAVGSCDSASMELAILLDGSDSVKRDNFEKLKKWTNNFIEGLEVQNYGTRVGVIKYATTIRDIAPLSDDVNSLAAAVNAVRWQQGKTNTGGALERARTRLFSAARTNVPKVILVVTDGDATDKPKVDAEIALLKESGVIIYAVGVGDKIDQDELKKLASDKDTVYFTRDYDSISKIKTSLLGRICKQGKPKTSGGRCSEISVDLQFIVDASASVNLNGKGNFQHAKNFVKNVSSVFDLRNGDVRVGVLTYETDVNVAAQIKLGKIESKDSFNDAVDALPYTGGDTHTGAALQHIETHNNWREEVPKILIFITDGRPQDRRLVPAAAKSLRDKGVRIFAIGVGEATREELEEIASTPYKDHIIFIKGADYSKVQQIRGFLEQLVCSEVVAFADGVGTNELDQGILTRPNQPSFSLQVGGNHYATPEPPLSPQFVPDVVEPEVVKPAQTPGVGKEGTPNDYNGGTGTPTELPIESHPEGDIDDPIGGEGLAPGSIWDNSEYTRTIAGYAKYDDCPVYRRNGKIMRGADLLSVWGYTAWSGAALAGSMPGYHSFGFSGESLPKKQLSSIFPRGLTDIFSIVFTASLTQQGAIGLKIWDQNQEYASIAVTPSGLSVTREGKSGSFSASLLPPIFDGGFHKYQIFFDRNAVVVMIDCIQIGTLNLGTTSGVTDAATIEILGNTFGKVQDLAIICGLTDAEECCEIEDALCSTNRLVGFSSDSASGFSIGGGEVSKWRAFGMVNSSADERCVCPPAANQGLSHEDIEFIKQFLHKTRQ